MEYNKLVRDRIPEYIMSKGGIPVTHIADEKEYYEKLLEKMIEEFEEFKEDENLEKYVDMLEVLEAIRDFKGFKQEDIDAFRKKKEEERGIFKKRIILDEA